MKDLTGLKFGRLIVIRFFEKRGHNNYWLCRCECGKEKAICAYSLTSGKTKSCGCLNKELSKGRVLTHNLSKTRIYNTYYKMKSRCYNQNDRKYKNYGTRGIQVCDEWKNDFLNFYNWSMQNGYEEHLTIDRIDVNGNYEPNNCRWITMKEQANNKTTSRLINFNNETRSLVDWSKALNIPYNILECRLNKHKWSVKKAFTTPIKTNLPL